VPSVPFALRRPLLLVRGARVDRDRPDLRHLESIDDPERFAWAILPHVARSFAVSVIWLPRAAARAACVGYLYARMLDTYEDLVADRHQRSAGLRWLARRIGDQDFDAPAPAVRMAPTDEREQAHRLLVERHDLVDRLFRSLPATDRTRIGALVTEMAASMEYWTATFEEQGGVLDTPDQLGRYCDDVIGEPARFAVSLLTEGPLTPIQRERVSAVAEFVQLANVTRDIESDLERGVAYHPSLRPLLGAPDGAERVIAEVRSDLLMRGLRSSTAFTDLLLELPLPRFSVGRGSGVVMFLFTDRYYRSAVARIGHPPWDGHRSTVAILWSGLLSTVSRSWTRRLATRVGRRMADAAEAMAGSPFPSPD
jgi:phytoene/squalene synthetase